MITHIKGRLSEKSPTNVVIETNGIGYWINISLTTFSQIPDQENIKLFTHLQIKEDSHSLYGFYTLKEREIFRDQLKSTNKPPDIIEKIIEGKIKKFYDEVCLLEQFFVMDPKVKIKDVIQELNKNNNNDFKIISYYMYKLGQQD